MFTLERQTASTSLTLNSCFLIGGLIMLSQKHTKASKVNYKSGFFITTNVLLDFGHERDQNAIYRRLKVFSTKALPRKDSSISGKEVRLLFYRNIAIVHAIYSEASKETETKCCDLFSL